MQRCSKSYWFSSSRLFFFITFALCLSLNFNPTPPQLEESNRTLTVDVANLASEKEELNNQLKDMQQRECNLFIQPISAGVTGKCVEILPYA